MKTEACVSSILPGRCHPSRSATLRTVVGDGNFMLIRVFDAGDGDGDGDDV